MEPTSQGSVEAADDLERRLFFEQFNAGYEWLRDVPEEWAEVEFE